MIRTLRAALEDNLQENVDLCHAIVPWLVLDAGEVATRFRIRKDGKTTETDPVV